MYYFSKKTVAYQDALRTCDYLLIDTSNIISYLKQSIIINMSQSSHMAQKANPESKIADFFIDTNLIFISMSSLYS